MRLTTYFKISSKKKLILLFPSQIDLKDLEHRCFSAILPMKPRPPLDTFSRTHRNASSNILMRKKGIKKYKKICCITCGLQVPFDQMIRVTYQMIIKEFKFRKEKVQDQKNYFDTPKKPKFNTFVNVLKKTRNKDKDKIPPIISKVYPKMTYIQFQKESLKDEFLQKKIGFLFRVYNWKPQKERFYAKETLKALEAKGYVFQTKDEEKK